jgi:hypothetical protein
MPGTPTSDIIGVNLKHSRLFSQRRILCIFSHWTLPHRTYVWSCLTCLIHSIQQWPKWSPLMFTANSNSDLHFWLLCQKFSYTAQHGHCVSSHSRSPFSGKRFHHLLDTYWMFHCTTLADHIHCLVPYTLCLMEWTGSLCNKVKKHEQPQVSRFTFLNMDFC